jgi:hypothetical protein
LLLLVGSALVLTMNSIIPALAATIVCGRDPVDTVGAQPAADPVAGLSVSQNAGVVLVPELVTLGAEAGSDAVEHV